MADDDDTFVTIGTPFDIPEEDGPKKKALPVHEQFATDKEGRRRFHGAFTGGFSAGYFNTVGSKEGWTPSSFISSRAKRFESSQQRPEDFMDEDDLSEFGIAPRNVETTKIFSRERNNLEKREESVNRLGVSLDSMVRHALDDLVVPCRMSIGVDLLKKMGWKEGQGIGPRVRQVSKKKVYGCVLPPGFQTSEEEMDQHDIYAEGLLFAPKDTKPIKFVPKDNLHGIGYKGMIAPGSFIPPKTDYPSNRHIKGQAFGVGAFEEDDEDIYSQDSISNYDIELRDQKPTESHLHGWTGPPVYSEKGGALSSFTQASRPRPANTVFPPPSVPRGYQPFSSIGESSTEKTDKEENEKRSSHHLTSEERGKLLGEKPLPGPVKSVFDYMSKTDKDRIASINSAKPITSAEDRTTSAIRPSLSSQANNFAVPVGFQPFAKDSAKQARYEYFLECRKNGKEVNIPKELCGGLTEWEREREKEEFARSAMIFQPLKGSIAARFTRGRDIDDDINDIRQGRSDDDEQTIQREAAGATMFGKLTRNTFEWHPAKLLCKRFNIPEPYPSSKTVGLVQERKEKFTLGHLFKSSTQVTEEPVNPTTAPTEANVPLLPALPETEQKTTAEGGHRSEHKVLPTAPGATIFLGASSEQNSKEKPSMDLFKAIFASSSEDESEESQSEDEVQNANNDTNHASISVPDVAVSEQVTFDSHTSKDIHTSSDDFSKTFKMEKIPNENQAQQNTMEVDEYGPKPPPRTSGKTDNVPMSQFYCKTVPFSGSVSESDSEPDRNKSKKKHKQKHKRKHKHRHRHKGKEKEEVKQKEKKKSSERFDDMKEWDSKNFVSEKCQKSEKTELSTDKEILSKIKAVQKKRMCAADFM